MAYFHYRKCGHLEFTKPHRTLSRIPVDGYCRACVAHNRSNLIDARVTVEVRRRLFVHVSKYQNTRVQRDTHVLAVKELRSK